MPVKITRKLKKRMYRKRRGMVRRRRYATRRVNDYAGVSETIDLYGTSANVPGQVNNFTSIPANTVANVYTTSDIQLTDFIRASAVARNYQYYKMKYVEIEILPDADTFAPGAASGKPYFYYQIDKGNAIPNSTTNVALKTSGCKPIALDEKPIHVRFKPACLLAVNYASGSSGNVSTAGMYRVSPRLVTTSIPGSNTTPALNDTAHQGMKFFVENNGLAVNYRAKITVHFQFYKPLVQEAPDSQV